MLLRKEVLHYDIKDEHVLAVPTKPADGTWYLSSRVTIPVETRMLESRVLWSTRAT